MCVCVYNVKLCVMLSGGEERYRSNKVGKGLRSDRGGPTFSGMLGQRRHL